MNKTIYIRNAELWEAVRAKALTESRSVSDVINELLAGYISGTSQNDRVTLDRIRELLK